MPSSPQSPQRTQRLFWVVIHPNHLCALGGLCGEYFPCPPYPPPPLVAASVMISKPRSLPFITAGTPSTIHTGAGTPFK